MRWCARPVSPPDGFQRARDGIDDSLRRLAAIRADRQPPSGHRARDRSRRRSSSWECRAAARAFCTRCSQRIRSSEPRSCGRSRRLRRRRMRQRSISDPRAQAFDDYVRVAFAGEWQDVLKAHPIGARVPQECGMMLETAFCSANPAMLFRVPSFFDWFLGADTSFGYEVHRLWLAHLQWRNPRPRWVLKIQEHMYHMPELVAAYPGARGGAAASRSGDGHRVHIAPHPSDSQQQLRRAGSGGARPRDARAVESRPGALDEVSRAPIPSSRCMT